MLWTGRIDCHGTGYFSVYGEDHLVERAQWMFHYGVIPAFYKILHVCDMKHCVNIRHLILVHRNDVSKLQS